MSEERKRGRRPGADVGTRSADVGTGRPRREVDDEERPIARDVAPGRKALVNVGLARGLVGRPSRGLVPIRGHSGVQGGAEVGCVPIVDAATAVRWSAVWGFTVTSGRGWTAAEMIDHAAAGDVDGPYGTGPEERSYPGLATLSGQTKEKAK